MAKVINKRRYSRSDCEVPVDGQAGSEFDCVQTLDISKRGLGFLSQADIPIGKRISIELNLAEFEDPVFVVGEVKWSQPDNGGHFHIGIQFVDILHGSKGRLDKHFKRQGVRRWL